MKNKLRNKRIAVYIALFILLLGGSFVIYQVIKADNNTIDWAIKYVMNPNITE